MPRHPSCCIYEGGQSHCWRRRGASGEAGQASGGAGDELAGEAVPVTARLLPVKLQDTIPVNYSAVYLQDSSPFNSTSYATRPCQRQRPAIHFGLFGRKPTTEPNDRGTDLSVPFYFRDRSVQLFTEPIISDHRSTEPFGSVAPNAHP
jgi:hypothetical protein